MTAFLTELEVDEVPQPLPMTTLFNAKNAPIRDLPLNDRQRVKTAPPSISQTRDGFYRSKRFHRPLGASDALEFTQCIESAEKNNKEQLDVLYSRENAGDYNFKTHEVNQNLRLKPIQRSGKPHFFRLQAVEAPIVEDPRWFQLAKSQFGQGSVNVGFQRQNSVIEIRNSLRQRQSITSELVKQQMESELCYIRYQFKK